MMYLICLFLIPLFLIELVLDGLHCETWSRVYVVKIRHRVQFLVNFLKQHDYHFIQIGPLDLVGWCEK